MAVKRNATSKAFKAGLATRRRVLGPDYVRKQFQDPGDFAAPFQQFGTECAWGKVWSRPGLSLRDRSLVTLAQCIALNRPNEIKVHLRGAVRNGITRAELQELCLHSFVYCGGPASLDAFHVIKATLPEIDALESALRSRKKKRRKA